MKKLLKCVYPTDEFLLWIEDGDWVITDTLGLYPSGVMGSIFKVESPEFIDRVFIGHPNPLFTTYRLRQYCNEFYPEVDFDSEFETNSPGVYERFQEKFGYDYEEWVQETRFRELVNALEEKGYCLPFQL